MKEQNKTLELKRTQRDLLLKMLEIAKTQQVLLERDDAEAFLDALSQRTELSSRFEALNKQLESEEASDAEHLRLINSIEEDIKLSAASIIELDKKSLKAGKLLLEEYKQKLKEISLAKKQQTYALQYPAADGLFFDSTN
ncbi:MAG TPA: hypothetical protein PLH38_02510 [Clostridia bacterium]|nr:hypothetical protein [Clostridia bacterium]